MLVHSTTNPSSSNLRPQCRYRPWMCYNQSQTAGFQACKHKRPRATKACRSVAPNRQQHGVGINAANKVIHHQRFWIKFCNIKRQLVPAPKDGQNLRCCGHVALWTELRRHAGFTALALCFHLKTSPSCIFFVGWFGALPSFMFLPSPRVYTLWLFFRFCVFVLYRSSALSVGSSLN